MRAFILRRVALIARGFGDVVVIGSTHCAGTLRIKEFLTRNGHPYTYIDLDRDAERPGAARPLSRERGRHPGSHLPRRRTCCATRATATSPSASASTTASTRPTCATWSSSAPGRPGSPRPCTARRKGSTSWSSSRARREARPARARGSRTTSGFPPASPGRSWPARAYTQAQKFGAEMIVAKGATRLACDRRPYAVEIDGGPTISAKAIVIATGAAYRKLAIENLPRFEGAGVYYGATAMEAQLCGGEEVIVVGGGNSAGQAAVFLAQTARRVHMLVRGESLADTMSRYLIRRIEDSPAIVLRTGTEIVGAEGNGHLERVRWRDKRDRHVGGARHPPRVRHDRRGSQHRAGWPTVSRSTPRASSRPARTSRRKSAPPRTGRWRGRRICSRPASRASSRSATCAAATSSASPPRSARGRSRWPSSTGCCTNRGSS